MILHSIETPADVKGLNSEELAQLCEEIRTFIVDAVTTTGGHLGSNLGAVELTLALHRVFDSPRDVILWDTGHQAYVHKLLTGRRYGFKNLRQAGGMSGYPNRAESEHDWIENSHASTALSYAHGIANGFRLRGRDSERRVVAVVGDGALTGGMAYEALNNLGHSRRRVVIVLNDNGRSYAPTVSQLSQSLTTLRLNPTYTAARERLRLRLRDLPAFGPLAYSSVHSLTSALREMVAPHTFFEALGVRYAGPIDGHDIEHMEQAFAHAAEWDGPIVVHVLTQKGRGYAPAEQDDIQRLHDFKVPTARAGAGGSGSGSGSGSSALASSASVSGSVSENTVGSSAGLAVGGSGATDTGGLASPGSIPETAVDESPQRAATYGDAFSRALLAVAEEDPRIVALTAAMPGPTGLLPFQARFPERFFDVGIAEQHEVASAAGMAMAGLRPVVAVYSTFLSRAFDQANLDVGLHALPVVFVLDRAGITGDDGPSHHGVLDLSLALSIPGLTVFAPSSAAELEPMLRCALELPGPSAIRFPKTAARHVEPGDVGSGLAARRLREGDGSVCLLGVGKLVGACVAAADELAAEGIAATVWDVRVVSPPDADMLADAARHALVVTAEDGVRHGGAGAFLVDALASQAESLGVAGPAVRVLGIPRQYLAQGKADDILSSLGLDAAGIAESVRRALAQVEVTSHVASPAASPSPTPADTID
jgi:1-deoxy-D-xylulose-5-phosphate synthase